MGARRHRDKRGRQTVGLLSLIGDHLFSVSVDALADAHVADAAVAATVQDLGGKCGASDEAGSDAQGRVYTSAYEFNTDLAASAGQAVQGTVVRDPRALWPEHAQPRPQRLALLHRRLHHGCTVGACSTADTTCASAVRAVPRARVNGTPVLLK